jgi:predicted CXXCH cytochrome family protein
MKFAIPAFLALGLVTVSAPAATYVGSQACGTCHAGTYASWRKTRMANIVRDPKVNPEAVLGDFSKPNPLVTFTIADVAFTYGDKWKQRYFYKKGNDYFVYPAQWDVQNKVWRAFHPAPGTDWWTNVYPDDMAQRPTGPLCDGCHSVGYNTATHEVSEWNVGCEKCHGPGSDHVAAPSRTNIVNPARLDYVRASDVCLQCHSEGRPLKNPIGDRIYDWPVGYTAGDRLADYWKLEEHKLGEKSFTHYADGTAIKNRMQGNDFVQSQMYKRGMTCFTCHNVHGTANNADLIKPASALCISCHNEKSPAGPSLSAAAHSHHAANSPGAECIACHMPKVSNTIADINVRSHTFRFMPPLLTVQYNEPNSCNSCHKDKDAAWAQQTISNWPDVSPWRMQ